MAHPVEHYEENRALYNQIEQNLLTVNQEFMAADVDKQVNMIEQATIFAILSVQAPVQVHERAYVRLLFADDESEMRDAVQELNYWKNKIRYIKENAENADFRGIRDLLVRGRIDRAHRYMRDQCLGLGLRKAGFSLADLGYTEKMCIDTNVAQMCGIPKDDIYNGVVVDKYENQCEYCRAQYPELANKVSNFLYQWILFDAQRDTVTTHDSWFMSVSDEVYGAPELTG